MVNLLFGFRLSCDLVDRMAQIAQEPDPQNQTKEHESVSEVLLYGNVITTNQIHIERRCCPEGAKLNSAALPRVQALPGLTRE